MVYTIRVEPARVREELIAQLISDSDETETFYEYQNKEKKLPVISLPLHVPIYRMANFRTRTAQQSYLRRMNKGEGFFQQENEDAQTAQHQILAKFAKEERDRSIASIISVLKAERQRQPLLITARGIVVNGNRRLAAMRELYDEDCNQFRTFSHVKCMVLPSIISEEEVVEIEVRLQMKRRTELPYSWIDEAIAIKELLGGHKEVRDLCALMNKQESEIREAINALNEADIYLKERRGTPGDYELIDSAKEFFYDIGKSLVSKRGEDQEISRRFAWALLEMRDKVPGRIYNFNPIFGKKAQQVAARLAERLGVELQSDGEGDFGSESGDFDVDIAGVGAFSYKPLISLFDDEGESEKLGEELLDVWNEIVEAEKDKRRTHQPLNLVQQANNRLTEVDLADASPEIFPAILNQLDAIEKNVSRLRETLASRKMTCV